MKKLLYIIAFLVSQSSWAAWNLNNEQSTLNFISTKNNSKTEVHHFKTLTGKLSDDGQAILNIDLASVETQISIRNERIKQFLFQVGQFATAKVTLSIDKSKLAKLAAGDTFMMPVKAMLDLHGLSKALETTVRVVALNGGGFYVSSVVPLVIHVADFGLENGLKKLQEIAKLKSIDSSVPVSFSLVFEKGQ